MENKVCEIKNKNLILERQAVLNEAKIVELESLVKTEIVELVASTGGNKYKSREINDKICEILKKNIVQGTKVADIEKDIGKGSSKLVICL